MSLATEADQHTPGPWILELCKFGGSYVQGYQITGKGKVIPFASATVAQPNKALVLSPEYRKCEWAGEHYTPEELEANARLMAASPAMLAALNRVRNMFREMQEAGLFDDEIPGCMHPDEINGTVDAVRDAVVMATGGEE